MLTRPDDNWNSTSEVHQVHVQDFMLYCIILFKAATKTFLCFFFQGKHHCLDQIINLQNPMAVAPISWVSRYQKVYVLTTHFPDEIINWSKHPGRKKRLTLLQIAAIAQLFLFKVGLDSHLPHVMQAIFLYMPKGMASCLWQTKQICFCLTTAHGIHSLIGWATEYLIPNC